jgi:DNA-binding LacI/PurR family transcriptional regulator
MRSLNIKELIIVDRHSDIPKYVQVSDGVIKAIEQRKLIKGDQLPSLRHLSEELNISFDTAKKAYDVLKKRNIVVAAQGKSNVVNATGPIPIFRIFLLFNKLGSHKRLLYDAFAGAFPSRTEIDLHVYNNDLQLFKLLLKTKATGYTHYVIIPHLSDDPRQIGAIIDKYLGGKQIVLLDKKVEGIQSGYASVHEDFGSDIYNALQEAITSLRRYSGLHLIYPEDSYYPPEIMKGFEEFSRSNGFEFKTHTGTSTGLAIQKGNVFITLTDDDLTRVIQKIRTTNLEIGKDVGIISYNETPLKEVLLDGITTVSTDFKKMGQLAAEQVIKHTTDKISVPIKLTLRKSL